ncbi:YdbL family protein [Hephaestia sp. MAHUQ-44]|uniref:YdbL family protein n=2 Tax=unclassified Hephaestia TaxID=2631281 RepID=UPI00207720B7|nr:YdbL family protein [Hephaestia sp. MAHUQ-44]MCM8729596.1 YdbL family protein [Hephaestia sp. MAHUQ-44]
MKQGKMMFVAALAVGTLVVAGLATSAYAQRDPAYAAARAGGQIGEQPDGYLGIVGAATPDLRGLVNNINIQRKAAYTKQAASGATVEQMAFVAGCNLILKTVAGEKYKAPDGTWKTRGAAAPERDPRCV